MNYPQLDQAIKVSPKILTIIQQLDSTQMELNIDRLAKMVNIMFSEAYPAATQNCLDKRVAKKITPRSIRHYQTQKCISRAGRSGRDAIYDSNHCKQALIIRKLLALGATKKQIQNTLQSAEPKDYNILLIHGLDYKYMSAIPLTDTKSDEPSNESPTPIPDDITRPSSWVRVPIQPGVELHFEHTQINLDDETVAQILENIPKRLRAEI